MSPRARRKNDDEAATYSLEQSNGGSSSSDGTTTSSTTDKRKEDFASKRLTLSDLVDVNKPWVLVPNGSLNGFFDFVPEHLRYGPWSICAIIYLPIIFCCSFFYIVRTYYSTSFDESFDWKNNSGDGSYPDVFSIGWYYNTIGFVWTSYVLVSSLRTPRGLKVLVMYTLWSWVNLWIRHGLCAIAPLIITTNASYDDETSKNYRLPFILLLEYTRFPMLVTASVTFVVWNFCLMPYILFFTRMPDERRKKLLAYFCSWRLVQLHIFNILYAAINGILSCPARSLNSFDFAVALSQANVYMIWYLFVLDRIGVHLYPIFSPRTPLSLISWSMIFVVYNGLFYFWNNILSSNIANR